MRTTACLLLVLLATAQAQTLYRVVGSDGKVTYTDQPPADPKAATVLKVAPAPYSAVPESPAQSKSATNSGRQPSPVGESTGSAKLFYATWCGYCEQARGYVQAKGISVREIDIDSPGGAREYAEAGGRRGIPLLIAGNKRQQGFNAGAYDRFFAAK